MTGDPAGLARAIELIEMAQKRTASGVFPGAVRIRLPRLLSSHPDPKDTRATNPQTIDDMNIAWSREAIDDLARLRSYIWH